MTMTSQFPTWRRRLIFLMSFCFSCQVYFTYWSKFHVNIIIGSGVMAIFFYKRLSRNPEIENTPIWVLPNIWRLGRVRDTKFGTKVSNEILLNAAKCQGYGFYRFWVIKGKPTVPPSRLGLQGKLTFEHNHSKIIKVTFSCPKFVSAYKNQFTP